jgi:hypothetical protein
VGREMRRARADTAGLLGPLIDARSTGPPAVSYGGFSNSPKVEVA